MPRKQAGRVTYWPISQATEVGEGHLTRKKGSPQYSFQLIEQKSLTNSVRKSKFDFLEKAGCLDYNCPSDLSMVQTTDVHQRVS